MFLITAFVRWIHALMSHRCTACNKKMTQMYKKSKQLQLTAISGLGFYTISCIFRAQKSS